METLVHSFNDKAVISVLSDKIAFKSAKLPKHVVSYCSETTISLGQEVFTVKEAATKEELVQNVNASGIISCVDDGEWNVGPLTSGFTQPGSVTGVFESADGVRKIVEEASGTYTMRDRAIRQLTDPHIEFAPGATKAKDSFHNISGNVTKSAIGESIGVSGSNLEIEGGKLAAAPTAISPDPLQSQRVGTSAAIKLVKGDRYVSQQSLQDGRFIIPLHGENEGVIVNSQCVFQVVRNGKLDPLFAFRLRVSLKDIQHASLISQIPLECSELSLEFVNSKAQLYGVTDGVKALLLQGDVALPADCRLCVKALSEVDIPVLQHQALSNTTADAASLCFALTTPNATNYEILLSNTAEIRLINGVLVCNGVTTGLSLAANTSFVISHGYVSSTQKIDVSVLNLATNQLQQYQSVGAESNFAATNAHASDPRLLSGGGVLGHFICVYANDDSIEKRILAEVLSSHWSGRNVTLGTLASGTFSNGGTFADDVLTHGSIQYTRICPQVGSELQHIFGVDAELPETVVGRNKPVDARILFYRVRIIGVGLKGSDEKSLLFAGVPVDSELAAESPAFFRVGTPGLARVLLSYVDACTGTETPIQGAVAYHFFQ